MPRPASLLVLLAVLPGGALGQLHRYRGPGNVAFELYTREDLTRWIHWWAFDLDRYLRRREPTCLDEHRVREEVVPALERVLDEEERPDPRRSALIALARVGHRLGGETARELEPRLASHLRSRHEAVAEAAAVGLGLLGDARSAERLIDLLRGDARVAREVLDVVEVPVRLRAFAAYGLGLLAQRRDDPELRRRIAGALRSVLSGPGLAILDLEVAAVSAYGLCPLEDRDAQLAFLRELLVRERDAELLRVGPVPDLQRRVQEQGLDPLARAHVPTAMARLTAAPGRPISRAERGRVLDALMETASPDSDARREVQYGCIQALGAIANAGDGPVVDLLLKRVRGRNVMGRRLALIALARSVGTPDPRETDTTAFARVAAELRDHVVEGRWSSRPWAALAVGVLARARLERGLAAPEEALEELLAAAHECRIPYHAGAYLLALALGRHPVAEAVAVEKLAWFEGAPRPRGHCALTLGLLGAKEAVPRILDVIAEDRHHPDFLVHGAVALGLLGDAEVSRELIAMVAKTRDPGALSALALGIGRIGDPASVEPLIEALDDGELTAAARGAAAAALGTIGASEELPWNAVYAVGLNYRASTVTLTGNGRGVLDLP